MHDLSYNARIELISAYDTMITDRVVDGWQPHFLNFMFREISGGEQTKLSIMQNEVMRVYATLLTCVVRKPSSPSWKLYNPILIGSPDLPVPKKEKGASFNSFRVNDGWHFNACVLLPPKQKCRLQECLRKHFRNSRDNYILAQSPLSRIHVTKLSFSEIADYTLKHFKRGSVVSDQILVLPRHSSEL